MSVSAPTRVRFGEFEADFLSGELFRNGSRVPIQEKPFRILGILIRNAGELVTRKLIFEEVWADTYVQEDQSLNTAVRKVRLALGDSPDAPQYVETVGSRGYRFLYPVQAVTNGASTGLTAQGIRLAVLPFQNLGPDVEEHLSDGVTEEMIARLGRLRPHFSVIAPSSVMRYKNTQKSIAEIGQELAADYCLTGSIRRSGERVRITTQLISGADQSCIWSDIYDRRATDVFAIQNEVAEKVARSTMRLLASDGPVYVTNARAHEAYLRGRYFWNKRTVPALFKSIKFFEEAIRQDPDYALSYVGLADAYVMLAQQGAMAPPEAFPKAKEASLKALEFDPALAEAYVPLAWVYCIWNRDFTSAEAELRKALQLNPSYAYAYTVYAFLMTAQGRHAESLTALKRALHLDPVAVPTNSMYATALYFARRYEAAMDQCRECFELDPTFSINHAVSGQVLEQQGFLVDATNAFLRDYEAAPSNPIAWAHLSRVYAERGMLQESDTFLNRLLAASKGRIIPGYFTGLAYAARGEYDTAFTWLNQAEFVRSTWILFLGVDPKADSLRDDARYTELLRKLGLQSSRRPASLTTDQSSPAEVLP